MRCKPLQDLDMNHNATVAFELLCRTQVLSVARGHQHIALYLLSLHGRA